jgi:hypothetical protein
MRVERAVIAACALLCATVALASCGKSRVPSALEDAEQTDAGARAGGAARAGSGRGSESAAGQGSAASSAAGASSDAGASSAAGAGTGSGGSAGAQPPVSSCGGPWYRCKDVCSGPRIEGASRMLGECAGDCYFALELRSTIVLEDGGCPDTLATLTVQSIDGRRRTHEGALTDAAWERYALLSRELLAARDEAAAASGCADCADRDTGRIVITGVDQLTQTFQYEYRNPPSILRAAHDFLQALIDELLACEGPLLDRCHEVELDFDPDMPTDAPQCTFLYSAGTNAVSCSMPLDAERPCELAATCLCQSGSVLPASPPDVASCVASWLTPRGAITFSDVCTQGQTGLTPTLTSALLSFASAYGATVTTNPECDVVSAYY